MNNIIKEKGKKGHITYKYNNKYLYSLYDPVNESKKYIDSLGDLKKIIITSCGADYINKELLKRNIDLIISFEPITFDIFTSSKKIIRVNNIENIEKILLNKNIHSKDISIILWQSLIEAIPEKYLTPLKKLKKILYKSSISAITAKNFGYLETINLIRNLLTIKKIKIIKKLKNNLKNPALIISSGASLVDNINLINKISNNVFIFAMPSSLAYLEANNIIPDYIIAVDPGYATYYHLIKYKHPIKIILPLSISPSVLRLKNYEFLFFNYSNYIENILFNNYKVITSPPEGSVFFNLLRILPQLGFKETILIGQDFGYKNNRLHIYEGSFEREFISISNYLNNIEHSIKSLESSKQKTYLQLNNKRIQSNVALKLYFEHFISNEFDLKFMLPKDVFNPINNNFIQIDSDFINNNYPKKFDSLNIITNEEIEKIEHQKKIIYDLLKNLITKNKDNDDSKNILNKLFINPDNIRHIERIKKYLR